MIMHLQDCYVLSQKLCSPVKERKMNHHNEMKLTDDDIYHNELLFLFNFLIFINLTVRREKDTSGIELDREPVTRDVSIE